MVQMHEIEVDDELQEAKRGIMVGLSRYPLVQRTMLRFISGAPSRQFDNAIESLFHETDPDTGLVYLTEIPVPFARQGAPHAPRAPRVYCTKERVILTPFIYLTPVANLYIDDGSGRIRERQRMIQALSTYPILNPTLMQNALGQTATYFRQDLEFLVREHIIEVWNPSHEREYLLENVTARGTRYFLAKYKDRLHPFLIR